MIMGIIMRDEIKEFKKGEEINRMREIIIFNEDIMII